MPALVSPEWLAERLGQRQYVLIDMRMATDGGKARYAEGHVPGAVHSDYAADGWRQRVGQVPGLLPTAEHRSALFAGLGIAPESHVVLIPAGTTANDFAASARAYWTLKVSGHEAQSIFDGGTRGWMEAGLPLESGIEAAKPAAAYPIRERSELRARADQVLAAISGGSTTLIDGRAPSFFAGIDKAPESKRAGRLPGALSVDYVRGFDPATGRLRPRTELETLFAPAAAGPVISYCNTGHTAALNWFVLAELFGQNDVTLYDGSMTEWTQDDTHPLEASA